MNIFLWLLDFVTPLNNFFRSFSILVYNNTIISLRLIVYYLIVANSGLYDSPSRDNCKISALICESILATHITFSRFQYCYIRLTINATILQRPRFHPKVEGPIKSDGPVSYESVLKIHTDVTPWIHSQTEDSYRSRTVPKC